MVKLASLSLLLLLFSASSVYGIRFWALKRHILDIPNERSSHSCPTPSGGGIAIVSSTLLGLLLFTLWGGL